MDCRGLGSAVKGRLVIGPYCKKVCVRGCARVMSESAKYIPPARLHCAHGVDALPSPRTRSNVDPNYNRHYIIFLYSSYPLLP